MGIDKINVDQDTRQSQKQGRASERRVGREGAGGKSRSRSS